MTAFENLFLLRAFVSIVECGSISAGSRRLRISQPTLSRHLRTLEELCGTALVQRDTHRMCVTEAGRRLLVDAQSMLAHAEEADRRLREDNTTLRGHLRLFATVDCGQFVVTRLVSKFLQANPKVTVSLALNNRPLNMIQEGCDVGIIPGKIVDESVVARPAGLISLHLAASSALVKARPKAKKLSDLKTWPWITFVNSLHGSAREIILWNDEGMEQRLPLSPILVSEGVTSTREAVRAGLGVALLPDWLIHKDILSGRLTRVLPQWRTKDLPIHVVYSRQRLLPARVSAFIDFAVRYMTNELKPGPSNQLSQSKNVPVKK